MHPADVTLTAHRPDVAITANDLLKQRSEAWLPRSIVIAVLFHVAVFTLSPDMTTAGETVEKSDTDVIVMIGEIGGDAEERAADFIRQHVTKPVVGYVAGFTAPEGKTMGHAGAIVSGSSGTAQAKQEALEAAGVKVGKTPSETATLMREIIGDLR